MKLRRLFSFAILLNQSGVVQPMPWMLSEPPGLRPRALSFGTAKIANPILLETAGNVKKSVSGVKAVPDLSPNSLVSPTENCARLRLRKRGYLVLVRRGCIGSVGEGFDRWGQSLQKSGQKLRQFDSFFSPLTPARKAAWLGKKTYGGIKKLGIGVGNLIWSAIKRIARAVKIVSVGIKNTTKQSAIVVGTAGKKTGKAAVKAGVASGQYAKKVGLATARGTGFALKKLGKGLVTTATLVGGLAALAIIQSAKGMAKLWSWFRLGVFKTWLGFGKGLAATGKKFSRGGGKIESLALKKIENMKKQNAAPLPPVQQKTTHAEELLKPEKFSRSASFRS